MSHTAAPEAPERHRNETPPSVFGNPRNGSRVARSARNSSVLTEENRKKETDFNALGHAKGTASFGAKGDGRDPTESNHGSNDLLLLLLKAVVEPYLLLNQSRPKAGRYWTCLFLRVRGNTRMKNTSVQTNNFEGITHTHTNARTPK